VLIQLVILVLGLLLLIKGADWLVFGATAIAKKSGLSDLAIGLTVVAFGTSAPELVVNVLASIEAHQEIVFGNIIGSNNFNLLIILGITGLIMPFLVNNSTIWKEIPLSFFAILIVFIMANFINPSELLVISRPESVLLLSFFALFVWYVFKQLKADPNEEIDANLSDAFTPLKPFKAVGYMIFGLIGLMIGGKLMVDTAVDIAQSFGLSEKVIGLTIVAAGTSLPELATSVLAAIKKKTDIAVGNIIGSNIFNLFFILGISGLINPLNYDASFNLDLLLLALGTVFLFTAMFISGKKLLDRWEAALLLITYLGYLCWLLFIK